MIFGRKVVPLLISAVFSCGMVSARDLESMQQEFLSWKFGMFMHFNMSTFVPGGWSSGQEDPLLFNPGNLDFGQWADAAVAAKMKYAVLTVKHTGGWCLWDTETSDRDVTSFKNYKDGRADIVQEYVDAFRARGLKVGFYYCFPLWGGDQWQNYQTLPHEDYALGTVDALAMIKTHFTELLTNYGDIDIIWIDQSGSPNGGLKAGDWRKIKAHMHSLQPNCLVIANNATNLEDSDLFGYEYPYSLELPAPDNTVATEVCDKLNNGWFANPEAPCVPVRNADYVVNKLLRPLNDRNANLLLNCAPEKTGVFHPATVAVLKQIGEMWDPAEPSHKDDALYDITLEAVKSVPTDAKEMAITFPPSLSLREVQQAAELLASYDARGALFYAEAETSGSVSINYVSGNYFSTVAAFLLRSTTGRIERLGGASDKDTDSVSLTNRYAFSVPASGIYLEAHSCYGGNATPSDPDAMVEFTNNSGNPKRSVASGTFTNSSALTNIWTTSSGSTVLIGAAFGPLVQPENPSEWYAAWLGAFPELGNQTNLIDNIDGDTWDNLAEYALGGNPIIPDSAPVFQSLEAGGTNYFEYVYVRRMNANVRGLQYQLFHTTNLVDGAWLTNRFEFGGVGAVDDEFESVTNRLSAEIEHKQFIKLQLEYSK